MSLSAGEHYMAVSKMLGHASYVTTLTVYADYITESDGGKAAPLGRCAAPPPSSVRGMRSCTSADPALRLDRRTHVATHVARKHDRRSVDALKRRPCEP